MSIEQLKYIVSVAKYRSFSLAAENLFISQSAISQAIIRLENELNIQLFDRSKTTILPTKDGEVLINQANKILSELEYFEMLRFQTLKKNKQLIRIGVLKGIYLPFIAELIKKSKDSNWEIIYEEADSIELAKMLEKKQLDVAILALYPESLHYLQNTNYVHSTPIDLYLFMSKLSPLHTQEQITPSQLHNVTLANYAGPFTKWLLQQIQKKYGPLNILYETKNIDLLRQSIRNNDAVSIETGADLLHNHLIDNEEIVAIPFHHDATPKFHLGVAYLKQDENSLSQELASKIDQLLKQEFISVIHPQ
ncbi:MAG: LysR family transcriptional regulator [Kurthia sp.]|nr:LysR family transcriptional regulator [Candidatus Kurthia equi]